MAAISTSSALAPGRARVMSRSKSGTSILKHRLGYSTPRVLCFSSMLFLLVLLALTPADYLSNWRAEGVTESDEDNKGTTLENPDMDELMSRVNSMQGLGDLSGLSRDSVDTSDDNANVLEISDEEDAMSSAFDKISEEHQSKMEAHKERHQYQAEVTRLMDIIINSLYKEKAVFVRELISNSADALERIRFKALYDSDQLASDNDLHIKVDINKDDKVLSIQDTGIGMTKHELINNLGTVAKSGTANFLEALAKGGDINLIGQFGVGFYSAFLVADKVTVYTKSNDDESQYIWESSADGSFTVSVDPRGNTMGRGTRLSLHLKEDATEFLAEKRVKDLLVRYSQFISFPIYIKHERKETVEVDDDEPDAAEETTKAGGDDEKVKKEEGDDEKVKKEEGDDEKVKKGEEMVDDEVKDADEEITKKKKMKKVEVVKKEWKQVNVQKAIWLRPKEDITEAEYHAFYKSISKDHQPPLAYIHFTGEGEIEFKSILFLPPKAPTDMFDNYFNKQTSVKMYVRRILVADKFDDVLPKYLHFVRGVIDSDDLPLNVSREDLQQHKIMRVISKKLVRKVLDMLKNINKDSEEEAVKLKEELEHEEDPEAKKVVEKKIAAGTTYDKMWKEFSRNMKLGCYEDDANRAKISKILRFYTTKSPDTAVSLDTFLAGLKESSSGSSKSLYYASGESVATLMKLPQIQIFLKKGIDVLLLTEAMDEPCVQKLTEFEGQKFESIQKGDIKLEQTPDEEKHEKKLKKVYKPLLDWAKEKLSKTISKVDLSRRLVTDPVAVVSSSWGYSAYMEKIMKTQTFADSNQVKTMIGHKQLEINPTHPVMYDLLKRVEADKDDPKALNTLTLLFQTAMIASGFDIENPADLSASVYDMIGKDMGVNVSVPVEVDVSGVEDEVEEAQSSTDLPEDDNADEEDDEHDESDVDIATENKDETKPEYVEKKEQADTHDEL